MLKPSLNGLLLIAILSSCFACVHNHPTEMGSPTLWAESKYPPRQGNEIQMLVDGQAAYGKIAEAFRSAKEFIYLTISYGDKNFLLVPGNKETMFDILRSRQKEGVDVRMVVWQPAGDEPDTIPHGTKICGVNEKNVESIQARWDKAQGYSHWFKPYFYSLYLPMFSPIPAVFGCHHQKTYIMDDGERGVVAFVGGINPVQSYWDTIRHDSLDVRRVAGKFLIKGLEEKPPLHDIFYRIKGPAAGDVLANFVERYNEASIPLRDVTSDVVLKVTLTPDRIPKVANGIEVQVVRTLAPKTYKKTWGGEKGIREQ